MKHRSSLLLLCLWFALPCSVNASNIFESVLVADAGNPADTTGVGAVSYEFYIGAYEVTNAQYVVFLNAVAAVDPHGLWNSEMSSHIRGGITRSGSPGSYSYSAKPNMGDKPVNFVSFWDAARFANWLTNGQPTGAQGTGTTEDGMYNLNGVTKPLNTSVFRQLDFSAGQNGVAITSEDEWYKAAFYDPSPAGPPGGYWMYPTRGNAVPAATGPNGTNANSANYGNAVDNLTEVGGYSIADSYYGTFDQAGNVWEWNDKLMSSNGRGQRGGDADSSEVFFRSTFGSTTSHREIEANDVGFRVSSLAPIVIETGGTNLAPTVAGGFTVLDAVTGEVKFAAVGSSDSDGDIVDYTWTWPGGSANGFSPTVILPAGTTVVTLTVTDNHGATSTETITVEVAGAIGTILADDFDPDYDPTVWETFSGTVLANTNGQNAGPGSTDNSLWFGGSGERSATTVPVDTTEGETIDFDLALGGAPPSISNVWEQVDFGEKIYLDASTNGTDFFVIGGPYSNITWERISIALPASAQAPSTRFRFRQNNHSGPPFDHWAIDNLEVAGAVNLSGLSGFVWTDDNGDGVRDPSESGLNGITVTLLDVAGDPFLDSSGDPVTAVTAPGSGSDGFYEFDALAPGSYRVEFVLPATHIFSPSNADAAGINGAANSDADETTGRTVAVSLSGGDYNANIDAGLTLANPEITLTKTVTPTEYDTDGQVLTYAFIVENTGNIPLTNVTVSDPLFTVSGGPINLAVGEVDSTTFTGTYAVDLGDLNAGNRPNTATVTAVDSRTGDPVTDTDDALATALQLPALSLTKTGTYVSGAGPCNPFGLGNEFNALIFGNLNATGGDTDARLAVAGDATINGGYSVGTVVRGDALPIYAGGTRDMFIVGGDLFDGRWGVNGNVVHQGTRTGPVRVMPNGNLTRQVIPVTFDADGNVPGDGSGVTFAELRDEMEVRSALLGAFAERGVVSVTETTGGSGVVGLDLVGNDPELNIFHLTAARISLSSAAFNISVPAGSTTLVNVYGDPVAIHNVGMNLSGTNPRMVLFNLVDATSVETSGFAWLGSVLAPYADGDFTGGSIDGRAIFGGDVVTTGGFEFHNFPFGGGICFHIEYEFTVANIGNVTITDIDIDDPVVTVDGGPISLDPGESDSTTFTATYLLKASDVINGAFTNTATASGLPPFGARVDADASDTQTFTIPGIGSGGSAGGGAGGAGGGGASDTPSNGEKPDLQVDSVTLSLANPGVTGDSFSAVVEVRNLGLWKADGAILRFWNDKPSAASVGEPGEAEVHLGTMEVGEKRTVTVSGFSAPAVDGTYHLRVFADAEGTVLEQSEGNNQLTGAYTVFAPASSSPPAWMKPDFVVQSVRLDPSPTLTAAEFDVIVRVRNDGDIAGDAGTLGFWEASPNYHPLAPTPDQTVAAGSINPGEVVEFTFPGLRAPTNQGTYHARVVVDLHDGTDEYSTGNNQGGATYTVFPLRALIEPHPDGMEISWNSAVGYTYYVERSTSPGGGWVDISGPLPSTPPENVFIDDAVPSGGAVFYRVWGTN